MKAGELDRFVTIERPVISRDPATGAEVKAWAAFATAWAKVTESAQAVRGMDEKLMQDVLAYGRPVTLLIRWLDGVNPTMRVNDNGALYQIIGTATVGRREGLTLACGAWAHQQ